MATPIRQQLGAQVRDMVELLGVKRHELAAKLDISEVTLYLAMSGERGSFDLYERLAHELGFDYVVGRTE